MLRKIDDPRHERVKPKIAFAASGNGVDARNVFQI